MDEVLAVCASEEYNVDEVVFTTTELGRLSSCCKGYHLRLRHFLQKQKFLASVIRDRQRFEDERAIALVSQWLAQQPQ